MLLLLIFNITFKREQLSGRIKHTNMRTVKLACCWLPAAAVLTELGVELAAVMTPPVILNVVVPGLDKCPAAAAVTVLTEPSDNFTCAPWELPTTCRSKTNFYKTNCDNEQSKTVKGSKRKGRKFWSLWTHTNRLWLYELCKQPAEQDGYKWKRLLCCYIKWDRIKLHEGTWPPAKQHLGE